MKSGSTLRHDGPMGISLLYLGTTTDHDSLDNSLEGLLPLTPAQGMKASATQQQHCQQTHDGCAHNMKYPPSGRNRTAVLSE